MQQVKVTIPATTANLGPGFDCLGLALGLRNEITLSTADDGWRVTIDGEGAGVITTDSSNLVVAAAKRIFGLVGKRPSGLHIHQVNNIPVGSGLGSSAAATLGGLIAANALVDGRLTDTELLQLAAEIEGHPDNVVPAFYGGLTLAVMDGGGLHVEQTSIASMRVVIILPDFDLPTAKARAALPLHVPLADAVFNIGRTGLLIRALERGDFAALSLAMQDKLHQPYRLPLIPGMTAAFAAAREAGAAAVALSGAGPSVAAFTRANHDAVTEAITGAFAQAGLSSRSWILPVEQQGYELIINLR